jgi:DNA-binding CsgD family transcriptional regulator
LIYLYNQADAHLVVAYRWHAGEVALSPTVLACDDVQPLEPGYFPAPLDEAALLVPLYVNTDQIGAILFGRPVNSLHYSQADVDILLYPSDRVADAIHNARRESEHLSQLTLITPKEGLNPDPALEKISVKTVEDALRNLYDYSYLSDTPFAKLKLIRVYLPDSGVTHLERGKAVFQMVCDALEKLNPGGEYPREPIPREWYPYLILHDAYIEDIPNREIIARLYISEGTFNRTRRGAIRSVTRALNEMEAALN